MSEIVTFRVPWPPSMNGYWRSRVIIPKNRKKPPFTHHYISKAGKQYQQNCRAAVLERFGILEPTKSRLQVVYHFVRPDRRRYDLGNLLKALEDALTAARVWEDDSQIDDERMIRGPVKKPGHVDIALRKLPTQGQAELDFPSSIEELMNDESPF